MTVEEKEKELHKEFLYRESLIPKTEEEIRMEKLKEELYQEYKTLIQIVPQLTKMQKYELAKLTRQPEWKTFDYCLDRYKAILFDKGTKHGESVDDLMLMKGQCKNVSVFKSFWKRFSNIEVGDTSLTVDDPASTISLD